MMKVMAFDVGGTDIKYGITFGTTVTDKGKIPTPKTNVEDFISFVKQIYETHKEQVDGISVCLPCFVDTKMGITDGGSIDYLWKRKLRNDLETACSCPVSLENDGKAAALAEYEAGALKGCTNAAVFLLGSAVGGGLIINGQVLHGIHYTAGEFSSVNINIDRYRENGSMMRNYCSTSSLLRKYKRKSGAEENIDGIEFFRRVKEGDENAREILETFAYSVGVQVYNLGVLLDVEKVAIGGAISSQPVLMEHLEAQYAKVREENPMTAFGRKFPGQAEIVKCAFENDANLIGAYYTYVNEMRK